MAKASMGKEMTSVITPSGTVSLFMLMSPSIRPPGEVRACICRRSPSLCEAHPHRGGKAGATYHRGWEGQSIQSRWMAHNGDMGVRGRGEGLRETHWVRSPIVRSRGEHAERAAVTRLVHSLTTAGTCPDSA
jgi:hypothetical protein